MTTTYDKVIQLANTLQAEGKYDSTYSAVLAIYQELTGDTESTFDSTYSIVATIADGVESGDINIGGDCPEFITQILTQTITENGHYNYVPTSDGYSQVDITVDVEIPEFTTQTLTETITTNGTYSYIPDTDGYSQVDITVNVEGGGEGGGSPYDEYLTPKVRFYNYKGEIVETWTLEEAKTKTELPAFNDELVEFANGEYTDLQQEGWNWDLADIQAVETDISVGALYRPYDGKTYIELHIGPENLNTKLYCRIYNNSIVDWGDGTTSVYSDFNGGYLQHTYAEAGDYVVKIENGLSSIYWQESSVQNDYLGFLGYYYYGQVQSIFFGQRTNILFFEYLYNLKYLTFTNDTIQTGGSSSGQLKFQYTTNLEHITLPKGINYLYNNCGVHSGIKSIAFNNIGILGSANFNSCNRLKLVALPHNTTAISNKLNYCNNLEVILGIENLSDPNASFESSPNIKFLKSKINKGTGYCFTNTHLQAYYYTGTLEEWLNKTNTGYASALPNNQCDKLYINNKELVDVEIPESITSICAYAFCDVKSLKSVYLPSQVTSIGRGAFSDSSVEKVIIEGAITEIPQNCFNNCYNLNQVEIPDTVTTIGTQAFQRCTSLKYVRMPASLTYLNETAFKEGMYNTLDFTNCTQVPELSGVPSMTYQWQLFLVPASLYDEWIAATNWSSLVNYIKPV